MRLSSQKSPGPQNTSISSHSAPVGSQRSVRETGTALALETTGHQAIFVRSDAGVVVAKWIFAPDEARAASALDSIPSDLSWEETNVVVDVKETGVLLHPAAEPFGAESEGLRFPLEAGRYALATALHEPDEETSFELFRLRRV